MAEKRDNVGVKKMSEMTLEEKLSLGSENDKLYHRFWIQQLKKAV